MKHVFIIAGLRSVERFLLMPKRRASGLLILTLKFKNRNLNEQVRRIVSAEKKQGIKRVLHCRLSAV
jgi:hypothetical protein